MSYAANSKYQIMTPSGWQFFSGVKKTIRNDLVSIQTESGNLLKATRDHKIIRKDGSVSLVKELKIGDDIVNDKILKIETLEGDHEVYDPINVENGHLYYSNNIVSKNCAFIRDFDEIWTSLYPTLSTGGSAILLSTPNGVGGQYYRLWTGAESGSNDFNPIRLPWWVHPEHDQEWFDKETKNLPREK